MFAGRERRAGLLERVLGRRPAPLVVAAHLGAAATDLHLAPTPLAVARLVEKEPAAALAGAELDAIQIRAGEELGGGAGDGPEDAHRLRLVIGPAPGEALGRGANTGGGHGLRQGTVQRLQRRHRRALR